MILIKEPKVLYDHLFQARTKGETIGFVPTMGALHQGHYDLINLSKGQCTLTVVSIFVNPTQFNDPRDYEKYPITLEADIIGLEAVDTEILFLPSVDQLYPNGIQNLENYELGFLEQVWEGSYRPGHFQGVCQVMWRLLKAVQPNLLFMGQKDYQQCLVVKELLKLLDHPTTLIPCPTTREDDGLAKSSRNMRLSKEAREIAPLLAQALTRLSTCPEPGNLEEKLDLERKKLELSGFKVDYLGYANQQTLEPVKEWDGKEPLIILAAAYLGGVRLIDNMLITC